MTTTTKKNYRRNPEHNDAAAFRMLKRLVAAQKRTATALELIALHMMLKEKASPSSVSPFSRELIVQFFPGLRPAIMASHVRASVKPTGKGAPDVGGLISVVNEMIIAQGGTPSIG
jgi:hypothetical protein